MDVFSGEKKLGEIQDMVKMYETSCLQYLNEISDKVTTEKFSKGGLLLHRGYYCPSLIFDLITGNVTRGRLVKNGNKADYRYGFDDAGALVFVQKNDGGIISKEFIIHGNGCEIGLSTVCFDGEIYIETISQCVFKEGKLSEYTLALYDSSRRRISSATTELYTYEQDRVLVDRCGSTVYKASLITGHDTFDFPVRDGCISEHTVISHGVNGGIPLNFELEPRTFYPKKKRKIY